MKFTEEHVWVDLDGDEVSIGITAYAAEQLGDAVFVELPEEGTTLSVDDAVAVIESAETALEFLAPIDGEITEVNTALTDNPTLINDDPQGEAWLFKMSVDDPAQMDEFMGEAAYQKFIA
jgi:glycine cleavage system H protein